MKFAQRGGFHRLRKTHAQEESLSSIIIDVTLQINDITAFEFNIWSEMCTKLIKMKLNQKSFLWGQGWHLHPSLCNVVNNPEVPPWSICPPAFEKCISPLGKIFRKIAPPQNPGGVTHYDAARIRFFLDMQFSLGARKCWTCNVYEIIETIND